MEKIYFTNYEPTVNGDNVQYFGYGCIADGDEAQKFSLEQNIRASMSKHSPCQINGIFIDCISDHSGRPELNELKNKIRKDKSVVSVIFMFSEGHCADNPKDFYHEWNDLVISARTHVFFRESPELSSCELDSNEGVVHKKPDGQLMMIDRILFKMAYLNEEKLIKMGRKKGGITPAFIDCYWSWQMHEISGEEFMRAMNVSKKTIYNMSSEYENSDHYVYSAATKPNLSGWPKRGKLPEPHLFKDIYIQLQTGKITAEKAMEILNVKYRLDIHRIYLAYSEGRKGIKKIDFGDVPGLFSD